VKGKAKLVELHAEPAVSPDVADRLTEICEAVQNDRVSSVAIAVVYRDGSTGTCYSAPPSVGLLIAAVTRLQHRLLRIGED
jgi:hypothetical protein